MERNVLCEKDERGRWNVGYLARVRVTLLNGVSHEDCGSGEGIDNSKVKAHERALKSAITDAMKRAARHFGERLGNALYVKGNGYRTAPMTNKDALHDLERKDALNLFGDQAALRANHLQSCQSPEVKVSPSMAATTTATTTTGTSTTRQKENLPQNRVVVQTASVNTGVASAGQHTHQNASGSTVLPSPIASSRGMVQTHSNVRNGNPSPAYNNSNIHQSMHQPTSLMNAPQPPNLMAPPPRPMYNPGSAVQYNGGGSNTNPAGGKRSFDYNETSNNHGGSSNNKRQNVNPYNNRLSA